MTEECKGIMDFLGCECELFEREKDADKILARYEELRGEGESKGFYPLIVVVSDTLMETLELIFDDCDLENNAEGVRKYRENKIAEALSIDVDGFLAECFEEYAQMYEEDIMGKFRATEPNDSLGCFLDGNKPYEEVIIAKIPTRNPWELAVWVPMGGFNDCPSPSKQAAVFKRWHERYGAVPAVVTYDNWEMTVKKPVSTKEEATNLAKEQFAFCCDIVIQATSGWDNLLGLASQLVNSPVWYFWWD